MSGDYSSYIVYQGKTYKAVGYKKIKPLTDTLFVAPSTLIVRSAVNLHAKKIKALVVEPVPCPTCGSATDTQNGADQ